MNIVFRTDASLDIGSGHVMRCLTLAEALKARGAQCRFICREHPGNLVARIRDSGFAVTVLPMGTGGQHGDLGNAGLSPSHAAWLGADWHVDADATRNVLQPTRADWLVVDHYALDSAWELEVRPHCDRLAVIDDLADRQHDCDLLLDQTLGRTADEYSKLVPEDCTVLAGPRYALLRPEFAALREYSLQRRESLAYRDLLIAMGGVDQLNATGHVLAALTQCRLPRDCRVVVVMGGQAPWLDAIRKQAMTLPWPCEVRVDATDIARLMAVCDLAIGAAGGSAWERCALGVPSLVVVTARNQAAIASSLEQTGATRLVGDIESIGRSLPSILRSIDSEQLADMSRASLKICDGLGTDRVADAMETWDVRIRGMREDDLETVLQWRNHPDTRRWMYSSHEITPSEHGEWYANSQKELRRHLLIVEEAGLPFGFVQFTESGTDGTADWGFYVAPGARHGSGHKLASIALNHAFTRLGFRRIRGEVAAFNERSVAFHRKLGFTDQGTIPDRSFGGTTSHPVLCFCLDVNDWHGENET